MDRSEMRKANAAYRRASARVNRSHNPRDEYRRDRVARETFHALNEPTSY